MAVVAISVEVTSAAGVLAVTMGGKVAATGGEVVTGGMAAAHMVAGTAAAGIGMEVIRIGTAGSPIGGIILTVMALLTMTTKTS